MATAGKTKVGGEVLVPEAIPAETEPTAPVLSIGDLNAKMVDAVNLTADRTTVDAFLAECFRTYNANRETAEKEYEKATAELRKAYEEKIRPIREAFEKACEPFESIRKTPDQAVTLHNSVVMFVKNARPDCGDVQPLTRGRGRSAFTYGGALETETPKA